MASFNRILKYSIYIFIIGWIFLLGILVGRGTAPVTFDTQQFQKRLAAIANEHGQKKEADSEEKLELQFYKVLDKPVQEEEPAPLNPGKPNKSSEIIPQKIDEVPQNIPVKKSRKYETFKTSAKKQVSKPETKPSSQKQKKTQTLKKEPNPTPEKSAKKVQKDQPKEKTVNVSYTIQIAAYKDFKDAVSQMADLKKNGFDSYRIKAQKDGQTWYRVRSGSFKTKTLADQYLKKLKKVNINGMVIKRNNHENIKG
ncbi:MAG: SPOR domain-containing protein [Desulfobacteraceae bacterium]|nr:SPOR domain-containing protein [Desulfobacteraceae bacterium]